MLKTIYSFFWSNNTVSESNSGDLSVEDAAKILSETEDDNKETEPTEYEDKIQVNECLQKSGIITEVNSNTYTIDNEFKFTSTEKSYEIGKKVSFTLYESGGLKPIANVELLDDDSEIFKTGGKKSRLCLRTVVCQVVKRKQKELFVTHINITIDLNKISVEFMPIIGDWLELDVKCEFNEEWDEVFGDVLEIVSIRPLRVQIINGRIKQWDNNLMTGVINHNIYFNADSLLNDYVPKVNDEVTTECIESNQGQCQWRSLKIILSSSKNRNHNSKKLDKKTEYKKNIKDLHITDNIVVDFTKPNEIHNCNVVITNKSNNNVNLLEAKFDAPYTQCKILTSCENIIIKKNESFTINIECCAKYVGVTKELLLLTFEKYKIGRWIEIYLEPVPTKFSKGTYKDNYNRNLLTRARNMANDSLSDRYVGGHLILPPSFVTVPLRSYAIPKALLDLVLEYSYKDKLELRNRLTNVYPFLANNLNYTKYQDFFHLLLHLDEIATVIAIRTYDQENAYFIKSGEYLLLEVENLAERRPSLIVGDKVIAIKDQNCRRIVYQGFIHKMSASHVYIKFAPEFHNSYNNESYSVKMENGRTTYKRAHQAIQLASRNLGEYILFPTKVIIKPPQVNFTYDKYYKNEDVEEDNKNTALKEILEQNNTQKKEFVDTRAFNYSKKLLHITSKLKSFKLEWYNKKLNYYQKEAVRNILLGVARPLPYIIFGPPGTGKTVTLIETILQILRFIPHSRLLICAPSNSAANLLTFQLIDSGMIKPGDLVRLVAYKCVIENSIPPKLLPYCATCQIASEGTHDEDCIIKENGLSMGLDASVLGKHKITVSTCSMAGTLYNMGIGNDNFTHIIVDEAGQTSEPDLMLALSFLNTHSGEAILAGDPNQLGPVIISSVAMEFGLNESYLERLLNRYPYARDTKTFPETDGYDPRLVTKLLYNYRTLPEILTLPSKMFYGESLISKISPTDSEESKLLESLREILLDRKTSTPPAIIFHGVKGENYQSEDSPSWFNPHEASQVFFYINELYRMGVKAESIGIISPYLKQCKQISDILIEAEFDVPKIGTVEDFQGQEFNVILLSTVRSDEKYIDKDVKYRLGFIACPKKINVSLTRAKALLIIIGNPKLLSTDGHWQTVLEYCMKNNSYCGYDFR